MCAAYPHAWDLCVCRPDRSYIITGGLGGFGRSLAEWMVDRGARHLLLSSKRGVTDPLQFALIMDLVTKGVNVSNAAFSCKKCASLASLSTLLAEALDWPVAPDGSSSVHSNKEAASVCRLMQ